MKPSSDHSQIRIRVVRDSAEVKVQPVSWQPFDTSSETDGSPQPPSEPLVEVFRQEGNKDKIVVTCTCGKRIEIACET